MNPDSDPPPVPHPTPNEADPSATDMHTPAHSNMRPTVIDAPTPTEPVEPATQSGQSATSPPLSARFRFVDLILFLFLAAFSATLFYAHARGDLYSDEADYALASVQGFDANRWDRSDRPKEPERLVARRHYHAPLTVDLIQLARQRSSADRSVRMPFIVAGALAIGVVYLCGLALFDRRREIAFACALLTALSPAIVRMCSHALPWAPIILEILLLLWCSTEYARGREAGWLTAVCGVLGLLFVTSEMFFVATPGLVAAAPFLLWKPCTARDERRSVGMALAAGVVLFALVTLVFWPAGATGDSVRMLRHYIQMRHSESFPVNVGNHIYLVAPRWSYAYWYWNDYRPFTAIYALAVPGLLGLAMARKLHVSVVPLVTLTGLLLVAAHRAHIIGPEYLAHCLPFLTLLGGLAIYGVSLVWRPGAWLVMSGLAIIVGRWSPRVPLPGMDLRAQVSRWPAAAAHVAHDWKPGDKIVAGSQPVSVARWYLVYQGGVPPTESQFQVLPVHAPKREFLDRLSSGFYRYVAISNMFEDSVDLDPRTARILKTWRTAWKSDEQGTGPSRLTILERPAAAPVPGQSPPPASKPSH